VLRLAPKDEETGEEGSETGEEGSENREVRGER